MTTHVLLIEDDQAVRESVTKVLQGAGYHVAAAADGQEGWVRLLAGRTDLVLLDLNLPDGNGWDVFERFTRHQPRVPIIIITGLAGQRRVATAAGASALMEKPVEVAPLLKTIANVLAESFETRLRRMCGHQTDTKFIRSATPAPKSKRANKHPGFHVSEKDKV